MNVLFLNDSTSSANWGERAAAISLMSMVRETGGDIAQVSSEQDLEDSEFGGPGATPPSGRALAARCSLRSSIHRTPQSTSASFVQIDENGGVVMKRDVTDGPFYLRQDK